MCVHWYLHTVYGLPSNLPGGYISSAEAFAHYCSICFFLSTFRAPAEVALPFVACALILVARGTSFLTWIVLLIIAKLLASSCSSVRIITTIRLIQQAQFLPWFLVVRRGVVGYCRVLVGGFRGSQCPGLLLSVTRPKPPSFLLRFPGGADVVLPPLPLFSRPRDAVNIALTLPDWRLDLVCRPVLMTVGKRLTCCHEALRMRHNNSS